MADGVWIISYDEPLFYGRLYRRLIESRPERIAGVVGLPGPGGRSAGAWLSEAWYYLRFWGPRACAAVARRLIRARRDGTGDFLAAARAHDIAVGTVRRLADLLPLLQAETPAFVLASVPGRVSADLRRAAVRGWVNTHCGPLPRYRGRDAPFWCLYHGEPRLAVTLHLMVEEYDAGPILLQDELPNDGRPYFEMLDALFERAYELHLRLLDATETVFGGARPQPAEGTAFGRPPAALGRRFRRRGGRFV